MWFCFDGDNNWHPLKTGRVKEIIALNTKGEKPETLSENIIEIKEVTSGRINSDLAIMDKKFSSKNSNAKSNKKRKKNRNRNRNRKAKPNPQK